MIYKGILSIREVTEQLSKGERDFSGYEINGTQQHNPHYGENFWDRCLTIKGVFPELFKKVPNENSEEYREKLAESKRKFMEGSPLILNNSKLVQVGFYIGHFPLTGVQARKALIYSSGFHDDIEEGDFTGAKFIDSRISGNRTSAKNSIFATAKFLDGSVIEGIYFENADLYKTVFGGDVELVNNDFSKSRNFENAVFKNLKRKMHPSHKNWRNTKKDKYPASWSGDIAPKFKKSEYNPLALSVHALNLELSQKTNELKTIITQSQFDYLKKQIPEIMEEMFFIV